MAFAYFDRVKESSTTTGTGVFTLAGAVSGFQAFSAVYANGDTLHYVIFQASTGAWEVGFGTWLTGNQLQRTTVLASSNAGAAVNFSAGAKEVFVQLPASIPSLQGAQFSSVANATARDAIPSATLRLGVLVRLLSDGTFWSWNGSAWVQFRGFLPTVGPAGAVMISNGTDWVSGAVDLADPDSHTGVLGPSSGGTGLSGAGGTPNRVLLTTDGSSWGAGLVDLATMVTGTLAAAALGAALATSVYGRSVNSSGSRADIQTTVDGQVLRRAAGVLGFGAVDLADPDAVQNLLPGTNVDPAFGTGNISTTGTLSAGKTTLTPVVETSGSPYALRATGAAHTTLTASAEVVDLDFNLARTVQRATGAVATQRAVLFQAPTYSFVGASTVTKAATVAISGAPVAGTNATIAESDALWVQAGLARFDGGVQLGAASWQWDAAVASPTIGQASTSSANGQTLAITGQGTTLNGGTGGPVSIIAGSSTGASGTRVGGNFTTGSGLGTTRPGNYFIQVGSTVVFQSYASGDPGVNGETRINTAGSTLRLGGHATNYQLLVSSSFVSFVTTLVEFENSQTNPKYTQQDETSGTTGKTLTYSVQDVTTPNNNTVGGTRIDKAGDANGTGTGNRTGGSYTIRTGIGSNGGGTLADGDLWIQRGNSMQVQLVKPSGGLVLGLVRTTAVSSTQMPASTGDGVVYVGNATTAPSANPVSGLILWSSSGALVTRDPNGLMTLGDGTSVDVRFKATAANGFRWAVAGTDYLQYLGNSQGLCFLQANDAIVIGALGGAPAVSFATPDGSNANVGLVPGALNPNFQSGKNVLFVGNRNTAPTGNPTSGYYFWGESGVPAWRTSGGDRMVWTLTSSAGGVLPTVTEYVNVTYNGNARKIPLI